MKSKTMKMYNDISDIISENEPLIGNSVMEILKQYASGISVFDMMAISSQIIEENKYVQENYKEESQKSYVKAFILRVKEITEDKNNYSNEIDKEEFIKAIKTLKSNNENQTESKSKFPLVGAMASIYTTFILEEPIHEVGTLFPGSLKVEEKNGTFYCPVKEANRDSPNAVCNICIAEQLDF